MTTIEISIRGGEGRAIYADEMLPYIKAMGGKIERATHVEPEPGGTWNVDLSEFGGGCRGGFQTRQAALDWEVGWLRDNWLSFGKERKQDGSDQAGEAGLRVHPTPR